MSLNSGSIRNNPVRVGCTAAVLLALTMLAGAPANAQVRISMVGNGAGNNGNVPDGNFIELYNAGSSAVNLSGKSLQWASSASGGGPGGGWTKYNLNGTIAPHSYWLVRATTATGAASRYPNIYGVPFTADETYTLGDGSTTPLVVFGKSAGKVVLANTTTLFTTNGCAAPDAASVIDLVSWANADSSSGCFEGSTGSATIGQTAPQAAFGYAPPAVVRACGGLTDTNDNRADFSNAARWPRNSSYPANTESVPGVSAATQVQTSSGKYFVTYELNRQAVRAYQGQTVRLAASAVACSGTITGITVNLSAVGGSATQALYDNGTHGDQTAGDGVYTFDYVLPAPATAPLSTSGNPQYILAYTATDSVGRAGVGYSPLVVDPVPPTNDLCGNAQVIPSGPFPFSASVLASNVSATSGTTTPMGACCAADNSCTVTLQPDCSGAYWKSGALCSATSQTCATVIGPDLAAWTEAPFGGVSTPCVSGGGYGNTSRDVWYSFTPQVGGSYTISTCNAETGTLDTVLSVHDVCPPDETTSISSALACEDGGCNATIFGGPSTIPSFFMNAGTPYLIRVARYGSGMSVIGGAFRLTIVSGAYGACCAANGTCTQGAASDCTGSSVYQGDNTTCETFLLCTGACCLPNGACTITGPGNCPGDFASLGLGVPCNPNFCPQPSTEFCCRGTTCNTVSAGTCTGTFAGSASLVVNACGSGASMATCCYADFNHDGIPSIDDLFLYFNAYFTGSPWANVGGDGVVSPTIDDLFLYINAYFTGCS